MDIIDKYIEEVDPIRKKMLRSKIKNFVKHCIRNNLGIQENPNKWVYWNKHINSIPEIGE